MNSITKKTKLPLLGSLLVGGTVVLAAVVGGYFYRKKGKKTSNFLEHFTEEKVLNILREFKRDFYPLLKKYSVASKQLQVQLSYQFGSQIDLIEEVLIDNLIHKNPEFEVSVHQIEFKVLARNNVSDPDEFKDACEHFAKTNKKIEGIMKEIKMNFRRAVLGIVMPISLPKPESLTSEVMIEIFVDHVKGLVNKFLEINLEFREKTGSSDFKSQEYASMLQKIGTDSNFSSIYKHFPEYVEKEYNDQQLFSTYLQQFQQKDRQFAARIEELEGENSKLIVKLHTPLINVEEIRIEIEIFGSKKKEEENAMILNVNMNQEQLDEVKDEIVQGEKNVQNDENQNKLISEEPVKINTESIEGEVKNENNENVVHESKLNHEKVTVQVTIDLTPKIEDEIKDEKKVEKQNDEDLENQLIEKIHAEENQDEWKDKNDQE